MENALNKSYMLLRHTPGVEKAVNKNCSMG